MNIRRIVIASALAASLSWPLAGVARAQLPPSPADRPATDSGAVRPVAPPRGVAPPPPAERVRPTPPPAAPPVAPPPPPPSTTPPLPPADKPPADKVFGTKGVLELGGGIDFSMLRDTVEESTWLNLGLDVYVGYFVVKYFVLGIYASVQFSHVNAGELPSWSVSPGFLLAPGVAVRLGGRVFYYGEVLGGVFGRKNEVEGLAPSTTVDIYGRIGAETGVKLQLASRFLMRLGIRLFYDVGKQDWNPEGSPAVTSNIGRFTFMLRVGFSGFF